jgi:hypothetical protein
MKGDYTLLYVSVWSVVGASSVGAVVWPVPFCLFLTFITLAIYSYEIFAREVREFIETQNAIY